MIATGHSPNSAVFGAYIGCADTELLLDPDGVGSKMRFTEEQLAAMRGGLTVEFASDAHLRRPFNKYSRRRPS